MWRTCYREIAATTHEVTAQLLMRSEFLLIVFNIIIAPYEILNHIYYPKISESNLY